MTDFVKSEIASIKSRIAAIEFALESFYDYENEEDRKKHLKRACVHNPHLKTYCLYNVAELKSTLENCSKLLLEKEGQVTGIGVNIIFLLNK